MEYDPHEFLAEDILRYMLGRYWMFALFHLFGRGRGLVVADLVGELVEVGQEQFYLPDQFYQELAPIISSDDLEQFIVLWSDKLWRKEDAKRLILY